MKSPMLWLTQERLRLSMLAGIAVILSAALYFEHQRFMEPCALCLMQRVWFVLTGFTLAAGLADPQRTRWYAWATFVAAGVGAGFAIRQLWLQSLPPDQVPACGPGIGYMLEVMPFTNVLKAMILGTGNCAEVQWRFMGLSIPGWSLVGFTGLLAGAVLLLRLPDDVVLENGRSPHAGTPELAR